MESEMIKWSEYPKEKPKSFAICVVRNENCSGYWLAIYNEGCFMNYNLYHSIYNELPIHVTHFISFDDGIGGFEEIDGK